MERLIVGTSEAVQAEYALAAMDKPFTLAILVDNETISIEGFNTLEAAIKATEGMPYELLH